MKPNTLAETREGTSRCILATRHLFRGHRHEEWIAAIGRVSLLKGGKDELLFRVGKNVCYFQRARRGADNGWNGWNKEVPVRDFQGKQALVTGAAGGIGRAIATQLAQAGALLWLVDVDAEALESLAVELRSVTREVRFSVVDLTQREEIHALADDVNTQWRGLDLLVNNAGVAYYGPTHQMTEVQWDRLMGINLEAPIHLTRRLMPALMSREGSHIANMCSVSGLVAGGRFNAYHTTKYGLVGFTEALRAEYGRSGLGVTAICPGPVKTNLYRDCQTGRGNQAPEPPGWLCASPEYVAKVTLRAIRWNRRMVLITPLAHLLFNMKRFAPWLIDAMNQFSRRSLPVIGKRYIRPRPSLEELLAQSQQAIPAGTSTVSTTPAKRAA